MSEVEWLQALKIGDQVAVSGSGWSGYSLATMDKVTPTQIVVTNRRFRRTDGILITSDRWHRTWLVQLTNEVRQEIRRRQAIDALLRVDWRQKSDAVLNAVMDVLISEKKS